MLPASAIGFADIGSLRTADRPEIARVVGVVGVAMALLLTVIRFDQQDLDLHRYPIDAFAYLEERGIDTREVHLAEPDLVGNAMGYIYGPQHRVFYDDRFDMFPQDVTDAEVALLQAEPSLREELDRFDIDLVVVSATSPSVQVLLGDGTWRAMYLDPRWTLLCRRDATLGASQVC
jgi:hypothetical protein